MAQKTKKAKIQAETTAENVMPASQMSQDLKTALLIVSVVANLFIFTTWVALQVTTQFDAQIYTFLFTR
ncbi:MAG TPA: hypothetical protein VIQ80_00470 [Candidatus Saccharimonadales bacterium]